MMPGIVFVPEGEKSADAAYQTFGVTAVASSEGSGNAYKTDFRSVFEANPDDTFVISPDNDTPSEKFVVDAITVLKKVSEEFGKELKIKVIKLKDDDEVKFKSGDDIYDWLEQHAGRSPEELAERLQGLPDHLDEYITKVEKRAESWDLEAMKTPHISAADLHDLSVQIGGKMSTDELDAVCEAGRLSKTFQDAAENPTYIFNQGQNYLWKNGVWKPATVDQFRSVINSQLNQSYHCIAKKHTMEVEFQMHCKHVPLLGEELKENSWINDKEMPVVSCQNGLLDTTKQVLHPHSPLWYSMAQLPIDYVADAKCPKWTSYIEDVMQGDRQKMDILQEYFGYALYPSLKFQKLLMMIGDGGNGKSVYLAGLLAVFGFDNCSNSSLHQLGSEFGAIETFGKMANLSADACEFGKGDEGVLKQLVSGDRVSANRKNKDFFRFTPTAKLFVNSNHVLQFSDRSDGMSRRMIIIEFNKRISEAEKIRGMDDPEFWKEEASGILNWALVGLRRLLANDRFTESDAVNLAVANAKLDANPAAQFIQDALVRCEPTEDRPDPYAFKLEVYRRYKRYCVDAGRPPLGDAKFAVEMRRAFPHITDDRKRVTVVGDDMKARQVDIWPGVQIVDL